MKEETPRANRFHIGVFGRRNSGKSSLVNALSGQQAAIVSDVPGTTTDAVMKNIELPGIGRRCWWTRPGMMTRENWGGCVWSAPRRLPVGWTWPCWSLRARPTMPHPNALGPHGSRTMIFRWYIYIIRWKQTAGDLPGTGKGTGCSFPATFCPNGEGVAGLLDAMAEVYRRTDEAGDLTAGLAGAGDVVVLVMPQDIQAPKGRLILPQVQTLRNLLDKGCTPVCSTADRLPQALAALSASPALMITDSQVFPHAEALCPAQTRLTSFSILFARQKGDIRLFMEGAKALLALRPDARVLIAEACTHVPRNEDIGRVKLPRLLRRRFGEALQIEVVGGNDFPEELSGYDLVIHCGACMFTRRHVLNRLRRARACGVPVTNYGIALAALGGMLERVEVGL